MMKNEEKAVLESMAHISAKKISTEINSTTDTSVLLNAVKTEVSKIVSRFPKIDTMARLFVENTIKRLLPNMGDKLPG